MTTGKALACTGVGIGENREGGLYRSDGPGTARTDQFSQITPRRPDHEHGALFRRGGGKSRERQKRRAEAEGQREEDWNGV